MREHVESVHPELITRLQEAPHEIFSMQPVYTARTALSRQIREAVEIGANTTGGVLLNNKEEFNRSLIPVLQVEGPRNPQTQPEPKISALQEQEEESAALTLSKSRNKKRQGTTGSGSSKRQRVNNTQQGIARFLQVLEVTGTPNPPTQRVPLDEAEHTTEHQWAVIEHQEVQGGTHPNSEHHPGRGGTEHPTEHQPEVLQVTEHLTEHQPEVVECNEVQGGPHAKSEQQPGQGDAEHHTEHQHEVVEQHPEHQHVDPECQFQHQPQHGTVLLPEQHQQVDVEVDVGGHQHDVDTLLHPDSHHGSDQHGNGSNDRTAVNVKKEGVIIRGKHIRTNIQTFDVTQPGSHPSRNNMKFRTINASGYLDSTKPITGSAKHPSVGQLRKVKIYTKGSSKPKFMKNGTPYPDISRYFIRSKRSEQSDYDKEGGGKSVMVMDKFEDGQEEIVNYPKYTDRGSILFSLDLFEHFQEMGQDEIKEIISDHWCQYKGGGA